MVGGPPPIKDSMAGSSGRAVTEKWTTQALREATRGVQDRVPLAPGLHGCGLGLTEKGEPAIFVSFEPGTIPADYPRELEGVTIVVQERPRPTG